MSTARARFTGIGDLLLGDSPISVGFGLHSRYPGRSLAQALALVGPQLAGSDIVLGNLECPLTRVGSGRTRWRRDQMRGDPEYAAVLRDAGITALNVANNHALQHGRCGFDDTIAALEAQAIVCVGLRGTDGWCSAPVVVEPSAGLRVGLVGYCWRPRQFAGDVPYAEGSARDAAADIERLRRQCDTVIVSLHWGEDFVDWPSSDETTAARALVAAGASVIVGHHPQVRRPVETFGGGVIAYSLGNFAADLQWLDEFRDGSVLHVDLGPNGVLSSTVETIRLTEQFRPTPVDGVARPLAELRGLARVPYLERAESMLRAQRRRAYLYAMRHLRDYPIAVLSELAMSTMRNKLDLRRGAANADRGP